MTERQPTLPDTGERLPDFRAAQRLFAAMGNDPADSVISSDFSPPQIAGYVVEKELGAGGGGVVYCAMPAESERPVAIKLLNRRLGEEHADRAWRELHVLSQLRLPCVPQIIDFGEHEGRLYLVTEFIDGMTLDKYCGHHDLDRRARVDLLAKVADAVHSLHEYGIIHRDIKPGNLIVNPHGQPVIVDLGIASLLSDDPMETITAQGEPIGSPAFMAPEQARGERDAISTRSDVYGLGATAYLILIGQPPHDMDATIHEAIRRVAQDWPREPTELDPTLPRPLAAVLQKAVTPATADRYDSAASLASDLRRWLNGEPVEAGEISLAQRVGRQVARHPILTTTAACVLIAAMSFTVTAWIVNWLAFQPNRVVISRDGTEALLMSRNDNVLHAWNGPFDRVSGTLATLLDGPTGPRVILGFGATSPRFAGLLCAFDIDVSVDEPVWSRSVEPDKAPIDPPDRVIRPGSFGFDQGWIFDCIPSVDGPEIVAVFGHGASSQRVIRIYDLEGKLYFQACHDGSISSCYWMADAGLLVLGCIDETVDIQSEAGGLSRRYAWKIMALHPRGGMIDREWFNRPPGSEATSLVAWCMAVTSPQAQCSVLRIIVLPPYHGEDPSRSSRVLVQFEPEWMQDIGMLVDDTGRELIGQRVFSDTATGGAFSTQARSAPMLVPINLLAGDASSDVPPMGGDR
jgi:hypothetical protein